jgi:hypothetical protein
MRNEPTLPGRKGGAAACVSCAVGAAQGSERSFAALVGYIPVSSAEGP